MITAPGQYSNGGALSLHIPPHPPLFCRPCWHKIPSSAGQTKQTLDIQNHRSVSVITSSRYPPRSRPPQICLVRAGEPLWSSQWSSAQGGQTSSNSLDIGTTPRGHGGGESDLDGNWRDPPRQEYLSEARAKPCPSATSASPNILDDVHHKASIQFSRSPCTHGAPRPAGGADVRS